MRPTRLVPSRLTPWMSSSSDNRPRRVQSPGAKSYKDWLAADRVVSVETEDADSGLSDAAQDFKKWLRTPEARKASPNRRGGSLWAALEARKSDEDLSAIVQAEKFGFLVGETVQSLAGTSVAPLGSTGTVVGFIDDRVTVEFPKGRYHCSPSNLLKDAIRKHVIGNDIVASPDTAALDGMYRCFAEYSSGTPEAGGRADNNVDHHRLRMQLFDEKAKRELVERQVGALRLQVAKCDRAVERAVDRAVKQAIDAHEEAFRKSREVLQQQLATADTQRESALAKADDLARELSALRKHRGKDAATVAESVDVKASQDSLVRAQQESHELRRRLDESEATASRLEREQHSVFERLREEEMRRQEIEAHAVALERKLSEMTDISFRGSDRERDMLLERITGAESRLTSEISRREVVEEQLASLEQCLQDSRRDEIADKGIEAHEKILARESQGYRVQIENLEAELAAAKEQVAAQSELALELEARGKRSAGEREGIVEQLLAAKAELKSTRDAGIQLVALRAEFAAYKVRTSADMESQRISIDTERRGKLAAEGLARSSLQSAISGQNAVTEELEERLRPLHEEYLQFLDERGELIEQLSRANREDARREDQGHIYEEIIAELRRAVANEEVQNQNQARIFSEEYEEMSRVVTATEQAEYMQAEALRRERAWWTQRFAAHSHDLGCDETVGGYPGQNLSASSISIEMPSMMSPDLVGAAGLVGNLNESTVFVDNGLDIEPSASTIPGTIGQTEELIPFVLYPPSLRPQADARTRPAQQIALAFSGSGSLNFPPVEGYPRSRAAQLRREI